MPTTSLSSDSKWCMHVYKLPPLDNIPPESVLEFSTLVCSVLTFDTVDDLLRDEFVDGSAYADISFPVWLFHTCIVPSQEAILPPDDNKQMSFTT